MAWNTTLVERLRYYINDFDETSYQFTQTQLEKFLAIAAINVTTGLGKFTSVLGTSYTIDTSTTGVAMIQPDPVDNSPAGFGNLIVLNAACILLRAEYKKTASQAGWKIIDDKSTIDGSSGLSSLKDTSSSVCDAYADALQEFKSGNRTAGKAILSPYSSVNGYPPLRWPQHRPGGC